MYLVQIFRASPLMGLALCVCLMTIFWCFLMAKRLPRGLDKILTGVLGLIAIYQAIRVLKDSGVVLFPGIPSLDGWVDFVIASMYFIAALILKLSSTDRATTKVKLRLVEANEKTVDLGKAVAISAPEPAMVLDASPLATFVIDTSGLVVYWNPAAERMFGWKRDEVLGHQLPSAGNNRLRNKQGQEVPASIWTNPIRSSNGAVRGTLWIAADRPALPDNAPASEQLALYR